MIKSDSIVNLTKALIKAKKSFAPVIRENENPGYKKADGTKSKYADLSAVIEATEPSLLENGLLIIQHPFSSSYTGGTSVGVSTLLVHESGEFIQDDFVLPLIKQDAQAGVGAVTYARRAALKAILSVAEEDDDGNTASKAPEAPKAVSAPKPPPAKPFDYGVQAGPPKAENPFPNEKPTETPKTGSNTSKTSASNSTLPNKEEIDVYRQRFSKFVTKLEKEGGLEKSKGLPVQKKTLAYLLSKTGYSTYEQIPKSDWEGFFVDMSTITNESGIGKVVELINESLNQKESAA
jgi:hypothetical protein